MTQLRKRADRKIEVTTDTEDVDVFGAVDRSFERMFGPWTLPLRRPIAAARQWIVENDLPLDEFRRGDELIIRAELPGIDPARDVKVTVTDGMLRISAVRHSDEQVEEDDYVRRELRYGSFDRLLPLPPGVTGTDVRADYSDGVLEIAVPAPKAEKGTRIPITKR